MLTQLGVFVAGQYKLQDDESVEYKCGPYLVPGMTTYLLNIEFSTDAMKQTKMGTSQDHTAHLFAIMVSDDFHPDWQMNSDYSGLICSQWRDHCAIGKLLAHSKLVACCSCH